MRTAPSPFSTYPRETSFRRRVAGFVLAVLANALILVMLLRLAPPFQRVPTAAIRTITFRVLPQAQPEAAGARAPAKAKRASSSVKSPRPEPKPPTPPATPPPVPVTTPQPWNVLELTKQDYAASDVTKLPSHRDEVASSAGAGNAGIGEGAGSGRGNSRRTGTGPHGEALYAVEWYREPTHAEMSTYLPTHGPREGWGEIYCQTIERYHVDNCQEVADSPAGSGFARSLRQAAFQFLVRPPRIGGRSIVGSWVLIRIDWTSRAVSP